MEIALVPYRFTENILHWIKKKTRKKNITLKSHKFQEKVNKLKNLNTKTNAMRYTVTRKDT